MKKLVYKTKKTMFFVMSCVCVNLMAEQLVITIDSREGENDNLKRILSNQGYDTPQKIADITDLKIITAGTYNNEKDDREFNIALAPSDFLYINGQLTGLEKLDLSEATVTNSYDGSRESNNTIPNGAFMHNKTIKTIILPQTLVSIGGTAFQNTVLEGEIQIPVGVNGAGNCDYSRFGHSLGITGFVASEESGLITTVNGVVFNKDMTELHYYPAGKEDENYEVPEGVVVIRNSAFEDNNYLKNITLSSTVTTVHQPGQINYSVWASQSEIGNVFVDEGNEVFGSSNGVLYTKDRNRVVWSPRGKKHVVLSEPIRVIAGAGSQNSIFGGNSSTSVSGESVSNNYTKVLKTIDFPATLDTIENGAFVSADSLEYVICRATKVPYTYKTTFRNVGSTLDWNTLVYVPATAIETYKTSFWVDKASRIAEDGSTETNDGAFQLKNFIAFYNIKLTDATAQSSIATDLAAEEDVVSVTALDKLTEGLVFDGWSCTSGNVEFADATAATTTFIMPAGDVEIVANYKQGTTTGLEGMHAQQFAVLPNPTTSYICLSGCENVPYTIYNVTGKVVAQGIYDGDEISVSHFSNGLYLVKVGEKVSCFVKK